MEQSINMAIRDDSARIEGTELFLIMCDQPQNAVFEGENPYSAFAWGKILKDNGYKCPTGIKLSPDFAEAPSVLTRNDTG